MGCHVPERCSCPIFDYRCKMKQRQAQCNDVSSIRNSRQSPTWLGGGWDGGAGVASEQRGRAKRIDKPSGDRQRARACVAPPPRATLAWVELGARATFLRRSLPHSTPAAPTWAGVRVEGCGGASVALGSNFARFADGLDFPRHEGLQRAGRMARRVCYYVEPPSIDARVVPARTRRSRPFVVFISSPSDPLPLARQSCRNTPAPPLLTLVVLRRPSACSL